MPGHSTDSLMPDGRASAVGTWQDMDLEFQRPVRSWRWPPFVVLVSILGIAIVAGLVLRALSPGAPIRFPFYGLWGIFLFFALFWAVRWLFWPWGWGWGSGYSRRGYWYGDPSYAILRARYARGEITKDQYDQMRRDLDQNP